MKTLSTRMVKALNNILQWPSLYYCSLIISAKQRRTAIYDTVACHNKTKYPGTIIIMHVSSTLEWPTPITRKSGYAGTIENWGRGGGRRGRESVQTDALGYDRHEFR